MNSARRTVAEGERQRAGEQGSREVLQEEVGSREVVGSSYIAEGVSPMAR